MEDNIWNVLGVNLKRQDEQGNHNKIKEDLSGEKTLKIMANIILVCGIIATIIMFFTITFPKTEFGESYFNLMGFIYMMVTLISSVIVWAIFLVLSHISINLYKITNVLMDMTSHKDDDI